jgi:hypothetical protein
MSDTYAYDKYVVYIPADLGTNEEILECAIREAEERTRIYAMPCLWTAKIVAFIGLDAQVIVTRKRHKRQ